jgi:hypothetical protein
MRNWAKSAGRFATTVANQKNWKCAQDKSWWQAFIKTLMKLILKYWDCLTLLTQHYCTNIHIIKTHHFSLSTSQPQQATENPTYTLHTLPSHFSMPRTYYCSQFLQTYLQNQPISCTQPLQYHLKLTPVTLKTRVAHSFKMLKSNYVTINYIRNNPGHIIMVHFRSMTTYRSSECVRYMNTKKVLLPSCHLTRVSLSLSLARTHTSHWFTLLVYKTNTIRTNTLLKHCLRCIHPAILTTLEQLK